MDVDTCHHVPRAEGERPRPRLAGQDAADHEGHDHALRDECAGYRQPQRHGEGVRARAPSVSASIFRWTIMPGVVFPWLSYRVLP